jgi:hypothetical protein
MLRLEFFRRSSTVRDYVIIWTLVWESWTQPGRLAKTPLDAFNPTMLSFPSRNETNPQIQYCRIWMWYFTTSSLNISNYCWLTKIPLFLFLFLFLFPFRFLFLCFVRMPAAFSIIRTFLSGDRQCVSSPGCCCRSSQLAPIPGQGPGLARTPTCPHPAVQSNTVWPGPQGLSPDAPVATLILVEAHPSPQLSEP